MYRTAKVAKQIVDYFTMALNTLEQGGSEDGTAVSDTVGTKIYKVNKIVIFIFGSYFIHNFLNKVINFYKENNHYKFAELETLCEV